MSRSPVLTPDAPAAIGPYSQAIKAGGLIFVSGQIPLDPKTGELVKGTIEEETRRVLTSLGAILTAAGTDFSKAVRTTIFLTDLGDFAKVNSVYGEFFQNPYPARVTVQVSALPRGCRVEIDCIAQVPH